MAAIITTIRPTSPKDSEIVATYFPRNRRDTPESERKLACFAVVTLPEINIHWTTIEGRYIRQALVQQYNGLLADAVAAGLQELPAIAGLADLLEAAEESGSDGIGRLSKEKISEFLKEAGIITAASHGIAEKKMLAADHPKVLRKLEEITAMLHALAGRAPVVETWLAVSEAFMAKYFPAGEAMTARLVKAIEAKREQNKKAVMDARISADDF